MKFETARIHILRNILTAVAFVLAEARAPIDNRYTFKYSEGITLVK